MTCSFCQADGAHYVAYYNSFYPLWLELVLIELAAQYCAESAECRLINLIWFDDWPNESQTHHWLRWPRESNEFDRDWDMFVSKVFDQLHDT